mgnify:CR=1 FL=1
MLSPSGRISSAESISGHAATAERGRFDGHQAEAFATSERLPEDHEAKPEQRIITDCDPFRLVRVGGAVFADVGRTWGRNPIGEPELGWLRDIGFGFRFAPTRASSNKMIHLDIAFPLDGDPSIDSVQILLESKRSF